MAHKQTPPRSPADCRHRSQIPLPAVDAVAQRLMDVLSPSWRAPRQRERRDPRPPDRLIRMRQRLLPLPVMGAILVRRVWRRVPSIAEGQQVLTREGWWGMAPLQGSPQAITKRLDGRPAAVRGQLFAAVCTRVQAQSPPPLPPPRGAPVRERLPVLAMGDGSTREALRQKTAAVRERPGLVGAGQIRVLVDACSHRPLWQRSTEDAAAHDKRGAAEMRAALPVGGLLVGARGFCRFLWCEDCTDQPKFLVPRRREQTASRPVPLLSHGLAYRDAIIQVGQDRSNPCVHPWRMVSVRWQGTWSRDRTPGLDPQAWSPRHVCAL